MRVVLVVSLVAATAAADEKPRPHVAIGEVEYYYPIHDDRQIDSVFANAVVGLPLLHGLLTVGAGLTATVAWGSIQQRGIYYDATAGGLGAIVLVRVRPIAVHHVALSVDGLGGIVLYTGHFPPLGDIYDFTWRAGPTLSVDATRRITITAGVRWMHVSNGQGLNVHNPSYEGFGVDLGVVDRF